MLKATAEAAKPCITEENTQSTAANNAAPEATSKPGTHIVCFLIVLFFVDVHQPIVN